MNTLPITEKNTGINNDFLPLLGTDHIEFYVGNAKQAAHFYKTAFGFKSFAYAGPETGIKDKVSTAIMPINNFFMIQVLVEYVK